MPIVNDSSEVQPKKITECRPTYVRAIGKSTAKAATETQAVREAKEDAKSCRDQADGEARNMACPSRGGCAAGCEKRGRAMKTGSGLDWTVPVKQGNGWVCTATAYNGYSINCYCPRED
jgi:hypothetical protein